MTKGAAYDSQKKEEQLRREAESWDTTNIQRANPNDIPIIDIHNYFQNQSEVELAKVAEQLLYASTHVGFYYLKGHGISSESVARIFSESKRFHDLELEKKMALKMDRSDWPVGGVGYLPFQNRKLPARKKGNSNEAFIIKIQSGKSKVSLEDNQWPNEDELPRFKENVAEYAAAMKQLALKLLPIYCKALGLENHFFDEAFTSPMYRLRMTRYPSIKSYNQDEFGISPHVDTTFLTILAQDNEGLVIFNEIKKCWMLAAKMEDTFIVNTGELLRQWTNDRFISVKHFANNNNSESARYSIPFFFNANADYRMECIPTCCSEDNPSKYPPFSYSESQSSVQGE